MDDDSRVRAAIEGAPGAMGEWARLAPLLAAARDPDPWVRQNAALGLTELAQRISTEALVALLGLHLFEQNWLRPHPALPVPEEAPERVYAQRTPAMAIGLGDHCWTCREFLTTPSSITSEGVSTQAHRTLL